MVCISIFTSVLLYTLPTVGNCRTCNYLGASNCIMGEGGGQGKEGGKLSLGRMSIAPR